MGTSSSHIHEGGFLEPHALLVFGLRIRNSHPERQAAIFLPDDDDEEVAPADLLKTDIDRPPRPRAEKLHRVVSALDATNGVEHRLALLFEVVEGAADEHRERRGHRVSP
jgi:hypothetical protein